MAKLILSVVLFLTGCVTTSGMSTKTAEECQRFMQQDVRDYFEPHVEYLGEEIMGPYTAWFYINTQYRKVGHTIIFADIPLTEKELLYTKATLIAQCQEELRKFYIYAVTVEEGPDQTAIPLGWWGPVSD